MKSLTNSELHCSRYVFNSVSDFEWLVSFTNIRNLPHILKRFITHLYEIILSCILFIRHKHMLSSLSIYFQTNLLTSI